jgi:hypothetical protein
MVIDGYLTCDMYQENSFSAVLAGEWEPDKLKEKAYVFHQL